MLSHNHLVKRLALGVATLGMVASLGACGPAGSSTGASAGSQEESLTRGMWCYGRFVPGVDKELY